ncbi:MAG: hypothetical protein AB2L26_04045 [Ignavibacteria bacterium]
MKTKTNTTDSDRQLFLRKYYYYEMTMFIYSFLKIKELDSISDEHYRSLLVENFVLHTRNLYDFYAKGGSRQDDANAIDFLSISNDDWQKLIKGDKDILDSLDTSNKVNKQLAHLTYSRLDYENANKGWCVDETTKHIFFITIKFVDNIKLEFKSNELNILKDRISLMMWN